LDDTLIFYAPEYIFTEIEKYRSYICEKANMEEKTFDVKDASLIAVGLH
jgi:predicted nucleic acid-binding protein